MKPRRRRELAEWAQQVHRLSQRRVARLFPIERMTLRYKHHRDPQEALRIRLRELAGSQVRYGYRRLTVLLKRSNNSSCARCGQSCCKRAGASVGTSRSGAGGK